MILSQHEIKSNPAPHSVPLLILSVIEIASAVSSVYVENSNLF